MKYISIRNKLSNHLKHAKQDYFSSLLDNNNIGKCFWGYVKSKSCQSSIPDSVYYKEATDNNRHDIADAFSRFFSECLSREEVGDSVITNYVFDSSVSLFSFDSSDIQGTCSEIFGK